MGARSKIMFKAIGNAIYKTPWWAMGLGGLCVLVVLALFTVPINVIQLTDSGKSLAENQAIQREIDYTFGDSALGLAERVVGAVGEHTADPARKAEFDQALKEIAEARRELSNAEREVRQSAKEAAIAARDAAREAALSASRMTGTAFQMCRPPNKGRSAA